MSSELNTGADWEQSKRLLIHWHNMWVKEKQAYLKLQEELDEKNANNFYHAQGDIQQVMPWSDCKESYQNGFNQAASILLKDMEEMAKALEKAEKELFRFNCDAPLELTAIDKPVYLEAREALKIWREKYGESNEQAK